MKITVIDYGMGNLHSVAKALEKVGADVTVSSRKADIQQADKILLPGVGSFGDCMANLQKYELVDVILQELRSGKPFMGICLGMQLLFESSEESPGVDGLAYLQGHVRKIVAPGLKIPHIGWNNLELHKDTAHLNAPNILQDSQNDYVYFVHSYAMPVNPWTIAQCHYGEPFTAAVQKDNFFGVQFHPERSGAAGAQLLKNFLEM